MKSIFTSNRLMDFLIRLFITVIAVSSVIIWSWDTIKKDSAREMLTAGFVILFSGALMLLQYCLFPSLADLRKPDERKKDERNEDE
ncbi:conjugal transfer protein TrbE [Salmonella enterica]|uniref:conjugal transfer protein TrbE n=1 Tax=Salmonella enterica TaxID=28901 RepID=UPI0021B2C640|nr:conjugal transfer protein TrbE [Salmonella enterica]MCT7095633.1 conjugal transfer protein TrbE [Salmonella enterica subsp. enterica serovar Sandiego]